MSILCGPCAGLKGGTDKEVKYEGNNDTCLEDREVADSADLVTYTRPVPFDLGPHRLLGWGVEGHSQHPDSCEYKHRDGKGVSGQRVSPGRKLGWIGGQGPHFHIQEAGLYPRGGGQSQRE